MGKIKFTLLLLLVSVTFSKVTVAQDFHLSQYDAAPLYLNSSMTGMFNGYYRITGNYRTQWSAIATKPFVTTALAFDMPYKKMAFGAQIMNNRAGTGSFNVLSILLSGAYDKSLTSNNFHHLSVGVQLGGTQKSVNMDKLTFESQFTPTNGGGFDTGLPNFETFSNQRIYLAEANAGLMYYYAKTNARINPFLGISFFHLDHPSESFYNVANKLPIRYIIHGGTKININEKIQLVPKLFMMRQINDKEFTTSADVHYFLTESESYIIAGFTYRNKDAAIVTAGYKYDKYIYKISYDINTSSLKNATNSRGAFELSVSYITRKQKPNPIQTCPRL